MKKFFTLIAAVAMAASKYERSGNLRSSGR